MLTFTESSADEDHDGSDSGVGSTATPKFDFPVLVSLDIDSIDPDYAPATGTPVHGGMTPEDVCSILSFFNERAERGMCHLDVVEVNPYLATAKEAAMTVATAQTVLCHWIRTHPLLSKDHIGEDEVSDRRIATQLPAESSSPSFLKRVSDLDLGPGANFRRTSSSVALLPAIRDYAS